MRRAPTGPESPRITPAFSIDHAPARAQRMRRGRASSGRVVEEMLRAGCAAVVVVFAIVTYQAATSQATHVALPPSSPPASPSNPFIDDIPAWAVDAAVRMDALGIMQGYRDGNGRRIGAFGAGDSLTRAQTVEAITRLLSVLGLARTETRCQQDFEDVPSDHWAFDAICLFAQSNWTTVEGRFRPDAATTRGTMAIFMNRVFGNALQRAAGHPEAELIAASPAYTDVPARHPAFPAVSVASTLTIMSGDESGAFGLNRELTRAEAAVALYRTYELVTGLGITSLDGATSGVRFAGAPMEDADLAAPEPTMYPCDGSGGPGEGCVLPHAVTSCDLGRCFLAACTGGWRNENGVAEDGCEMRE